MTYLLLSFLFKELQMDDADGRISAMDISQTALLLTKLHALYGMIGSVPGPRRTLHHRVRRSFWDTVEELKEPEFRRSFRMNKTNFEKLVSMVRSDIVRDERSGEWHGQLSTRYFMRQVKLS